MTRNHQRTARRLRRGGLAAVLVVLALGVWQGVALATATSSNATAKIEKHKDVCAHTPGGKNLGTAKFERTGNVVTVRVAIDHGQPNTEYLLTLVSFPGCVGLGEGAFLSDHSGQGQDQFTATVPGGLKKFFAATYNGETSDSLIVTLPNK